MPVLVRLLALCLTLFAPLPGLCAAAGPNLQPPALFLFTLLL